MHAISHLLTAPEHLFGLYEAIQIPVVAAALIIAFAWPQLGETAFARVEAAIAAIAARPRLAAGSIFAFVLVGRLLLIPFIGIAHQVIPDDGSLLLQASTLAAGRLANPPLPPNFETIYVLSNPAYASMYPVLRALPFAFGAVVGIGFWGGLLVFVAGLFAALFWALRAWAPAPAAYAAALLAALRFGFFSFWINSYYGPAFTALGGVILLGAYAQLRRRPSLINGALLGVGVLILMTSRPFEGMLAAAPFGAALLVDFFKAPAKGKKAMLVAGAAAGVFVAGGLALTVAGDRAVTGDWRAQPYEFYRKTSASVPAFFVSARTDPASSTVRYNEIRANLRLEDAAYERGRSPARLGRAEAHRLESYWLFYLGVALAAPFLVGLYALRHEPVTLASLGVLLLGLTLVTWDHSQYAAPAFGVIMLAVTQGLVALRRWGPNGRPGGRSMSRFLPLAVIFGFAAAASSAVTGHPAFKNGVSSLPDNACCTLRTTSLHDAIEATLTAEPQGQIVAVDSGPRAAAHAVAVINRANIPQEHVIWVNDDPAYNAATFSQYPGRQHWWLGWSDDGQPCLRAFEAQFPAGAAAVHDERPNGPCDHRDLNTER